MHSHRGHNAPNNHLHHDHLHLDQRLHTNMISEVYTIRVSHPIDTQHNANALPILPQRPFRVSNSFQDDCNEGIESSSHRNHIDKAQLWMLPIASHQELEWFLQPSVYSDTFSHQITIIITIVHSPTSAIVNE
jgi:hypothetical protein